MLSKKYNADAAPNNTLQFTTTGVGCCGEALTDCQYDAKFPKANKITAIRLINSDGVSTAYAISNYTTLPELVAKIVAVANTAGYLEMEKGDVEVVEEGATNAVLSLRGELVGVSVTTNAPATINFAAAKCNKVTYCDYKLVTEGGSVNVYSYNGTASGLGALVYGTDTATDVKDAIEAESPTATSVTVTDDTVGEQWVIMINAPLGTKIYLNSKQAEQCTCKKVYVA